jgi:hypothetical protein
MNSTIDQYEPVMSSASRSTTSPSNPGLTDIGESDGHWGGTGIRGPILALCRRPIRSRGSVRQRASDDQMTQTLTTTPPADDLVVPFHCDRCGALAKVRVVLASGSDLVFCGHHAREYETKLRDIAVDIIDTDGEQRVSP